jgi:hypothetical protein
MIPHDGDQYNPRIVQIKDESFQFSVFSFQLPIETIQLKPEN